MKHQPILSLARLSLFLICASSAFAVEALPDLSPIADSSRNYVHGWRLDQTTQAGRVLMRLSTAVGNRGTGPLEIWGGATSNGTQQVYQRIYNTTGAQRDVLAGNFIYHATHSHLHLEGFATYNLRTVSAGNGVGNIIAAGQKTSFCLVNITQYWPSLSSAALILNGRGGSSCGAIQGISTGYADVYSSSLPDQWIDVTNVPSGSYWLEVIADPDNHLLESNETNNTVRVEVNYTNPVAPPGNRAPVVGSLANQSNTRGSVINLAISASDLDGDSLVYSATGLPAGLSIDAATGGVTGTIAGHAAASYPTTVIASDGRLQGSASFTWETTAPLNGVGLRGEYYRTTGLTSLALTRIDSRIDFNFGSGSPDPRLASDNFSMRWRGKIIPPSTGLHTFILRTDEGARLYLNGQLVINRWADTTVTDHSGTFTLPGGQEADMVIEYYERTGPAECHFEWSGPGYTRQVVPSNRLIPATGNDAPTIFSPGSQSSTVGEQASLPISATDPNGDSLTYSATGLPSGLSIHPATGVISGGFTTVGSYNATVTASDGNLPASASFTWVVAASQTGSGLRADYYNNRSLTSSVVRSTDSVIDFNWGTGAPAAGVSADNFSVRWTGELLPQFSQDYTFKVTCDAGCRLWINGSLLIWNWEPAVGNSLAVTVIGTVRLEAGVRVPIRLEYNDTTGPASVRLFWASASQAEQIIPTARLFPLDYTPPTDAIAPTVTLSGAAAVAGQFPVSVAVSEPIVGLEASDFIVSNGSVTGLSGTTSSYTITVLPSNAGSVTVLLPANMAGDAGGNGNLASNTLAVTYNPPSAAQPGLKGEYFSGQNFGSLLASRIDSRVSFFWPETSAPAPGVPGDYFSVRWTGRVKPAFSETYRFWANCDDGIRVYVNGQLILDKWNPAPNTYFDLQSSAIALQANQLYDLKVEYQDLFSDALAMLDWSSPSQAKQTVPADRLFQPAAGGVDTSRPTVTLTASSTSVSGPFPINVAFNEPVTGVAATDFTVTNGVVSSMAGVGANFAAMITPTAGGPVTVLFRENSAADAANNLNTASNSLAVTYSTTSQPPVPGVKGEYFSGQNFGSLLVSRTDPHISFYWPETSAPAAGVPGDNFSVRWTGRLKPAFSETYRFWADCDDGIRVYIGSQLVLDHWNPTPNTYFDLPSSPIVLQANQLYDIKVEFQDMFSDAWIALKWSSASQAKEVIPAERYFLPGTGQTGAPDGARSLGGTVQATEPTNETPVFGDDPLATGLVATYFNGPNLEAPAFRRIDPSIQFHWGHHRPGTGLNPDHFSVRWEGAIFPRFSEVYTFHIQADDGARLWIGNQLVIDQWTRTGGQELRCQVELLAGEPTSIRLEYMELDEDASCTLSWSSPSQAKEIVPESQLRTRAEVMASPVRIVTREAVSSLKEASIRIEKQPSGMVDLLFERPSDQSHRVDSSADLKDWHPISGAGWVTTPLPGGGELVRIPNVCCQVKSHQGGQGYFRIAPNP